MSRMTTSCASLFWASPAMRRACSSDVSVASGLSGSGGSVAAGLVEAERLDQLGDGGGNEIADRLATRRTVADLARGDRHRLDLEQLDPVGLVEPRQNGI